MSGGHPRIEDDSGYVVTLADLRFLGISDEAIDDWALRRVPLGLSPPVTLKPFIDGLRSAIDRDGIDPSEVVAHMKGSCTAFFFWAAQGVAAHSQ